MMTKSLTGFALASLFAAMPLQAADYIIDTKGAHASIEFKTGHLGYSWLKGRFNTFTGHFSYDPAKPEASSIEVTVDVSSIDSNHAERDKHLRGKKYLHTEEYGQAWFKSTSFEATENGGVLKGKLTLYDTTKEITIDVTKIGEGKDPWGGYRAGFSGTTTIKPSDFGMTFNLGPAAKTVYLELEIEGIRQ